MFQTFSQTTKALGFLLSILALSLSLSYLVLAWTEPSSAPPLGNVSSPLNIGSTGQSKSGGLIINTSGAPTGLIVQSGNVGIGTTGPQNKLHIGLAGTGGISLGTYNDASGPGTLQFVGVTGADGTWNTGLITGGDNGASGMAIVRTAEGAGRSQDVAFYTHLNGVQSSQKMIIKADGNVGIGTTSPQRKLDVSGRLLVREGIIPNGWDTADWGAIVSLRRPGASNMAAANHSNAQLELVSDGPTTAGIAFHRPGIYGANFGLDSDNWLSTQGWSAGAGYTSLRAGTIRSMSGGIQFPDGTTQTSAAAGGIMRKTFPSPILNNFNNEPYAHDENEATAASLGGWNGMATQYLRYDFGVNGIQMLSCKIGISGGSGWGDWFRVQVSNDALTWIEIITQYNAGSQTPTLILLQRYRYLQFVVDGGNRSGVTYSVYECNVYGG